ncbi:MAG: DNA alkylation repair protein [Promethearchaeota archaeon]
MPIKSISSATLIRKRTLEFCKKINDWNIITKEKTIFKEILEYFQKEYDLIPEKERIGKGAVYISRYIAKEMILFLKNEMKVKKDYYIKFSEIGFSFGEENKNIKFLHFILYFFAEFLLHFPEELNKIKPLIEKWANHDEWQIRESAREAILSGLKRNPEKMLAYLSLLAKNNNKNLRRLVPESLRPRADVKWLRAPSKNDEVLKILTLLRKDNSIYVRKSVGNNIKDLSKYMPEKMLNLMESWLKGSKIKVHDELASEIGLNKEEKNLIWTIKHAMRWIKERNPEYHDRLEKILGKHYILYFDEKKNRLASPLRKK